MKLVMALLAAVVMVVSMLLATTVVGIQIVSPLAKRSDAFSGEVSAKSDHNSSYPIRFITTERLEISGESELSALD